MGNSDRELGATRCGEHVFETCEEAERFAAWREAAHQEWLADCQRRSQAAREEFIARVRDRQQRAKAQLERTTAATTLVDGYLYRRVEFATHGRPQARPTPRPRQSTPRSRRTTRRASARGPDGREPEPPLTPLAAADRRTLKQLVDRTRREISARSEPWRLCARCQREQEPEEFSNGSTYCKSCEAVRISDRRRTVAA